ncbi:MAG: hypothetical protein COA50_14750 [Flavobacteriaceae bacterium]|nr:MAG: hypothetical protein COA50_14750 [Flavobacteriaceae bacterium]
MEKSLLFIPDISGFTKFVQTTEVEHSQHVIAELLEVLIGANTEDLELAEVEGDALFFYKEGNIPSQERLLAQIESMFTAFHSHLKLLEKNRICPCNACASAPKLELKIISHCGELQFIEVQGNRKPFGKQVIESHRLLKNSVESENYALISKELAKSIGLPVSYYSKIFKFSEGKDVYDGNNTEYIYAIVDKNQLSLNPYSKYKKINVALPPKLLGNKNYTISGESLFEYISNFKYRHLWVKGEVEFKFDDSKVNRVGTEHMCVINEKHLKFTTITKEVKKGQYVYGELTTSSPITDELYQFYIITPITDSSCHLQIEAYWNSKSLIKKFLSAILVKKICKKGISSSLNALSNLK